MKISGTVRVILVKLPKKLKKTNFFLFLKKHLKSKTFAKNKKITKKTKILKFSKEDSKTKI
jgi:hypothetical protein